MKLSVVRGFAVCLAPLALAGAATTGTPEATPTSPETLSCEEGAIRPLATGHLLNNMWNKQLAGSRPYRQCLVSRLREGRAEFGWSWRWPGRDGIYAYPEVLVGRSPWTDEANNDARFPRRIADTRSLVVDHDIESIADGKRNLALEMWITRSRPRGTAADAKDIATELMIWSDASSGMFTANDRPEAVVAIGGSAWALHVHRDWGDASGGSARRWTYLAYVAQEPSGTMRYDAVGFLRDAIGRGLVDPSHYIADVELGNEIVSGSGTTWVRRFDLQID